MPTDAGMKQWVVPTRLVKLPGALWKGSVSAVRGEPAPPTLKVGINYVGGYRNTFTVALTGLDIEAKAALLEEQVWSAIPGGRDAFAFPAPSSCAPTTRIRRPTKRPLRSSD